MEGNLQSQRQGRLNDSWLSMHVEVTPRSEPRGHHQVHESYASAWAQWGTFTPSWPLCGPHLLEKAPPFSIKLAPRWPPALAPPLFPSPTQDSARIKFMRATCCNSRSILHTQNPRDRRIYLQGSPLFWDLSPSVMCWVVGTFQWMALYIALATSRHRRDILSSIGPTLSLRSHALSICHFGTCFWEHLLTHILEHGKATLNHPLAL